MKINSLSIIAFLVFLSASAFAQKEMPLYDGPIPNSKPGTVSEKRGKWGKGILSQRYYAPYFNGISSRGIVNPYLTLVLYVFISKIPYCCGKTEIK